ncbi:uncharacterized protein LOC143283502 [Babylonia areolata]|uniref:uncharacterized protein LOC143283502 n=1 Tax=Babylonia areolata TaxID=304850 RepID=UPI003FD370FB
MSPDVSCEDAGSSALVVDSVSEGLCEEETICVEEVINGVLQARCKPFPGTNPKPGVCPKDVVKTTYGGRGGGGECPSTCDRDRDCVGGDKCCANGCGGRTCRKPAEESHAGAGGAHGGAHGGGGGGGGPVHGPSCLTVRCRPGLKCVDRKFCLGSQCYIQAVCVPDVREKPGQCPRPNPYDAGICASTCNTDSDCKGNDKCCKNACGATTCQAPIPSCDFVKCGPGQTCVLQQVYCFTEPCYPQPVCVDQKPGQCPVPDTSVGGICASTCNTDSDCKGNDKCCKNGCGATVCQAPIPSCEFVKCGPGQTCVLQPVVCVRHPCYPQPVCVDSGPKPGHCPVPDSYYRLQQCQSTCNKDRDCPGKDKCCRNSCGASTCQTPVTLCDTVKCRRGEKCVLLEVQCVRAPCPSPQPVCVPSVQKPGVCLKPVYRSPQRSCGGGGNNHHDQCTCDDQCPGRQKCCSTLCGNRCQDPRHVISCANVLCQPDHTCVMENRCDRHRCYPQPVCKPTKQCPFFPAVVDFPTCKQRHTCSNLGPGYGCPTGTICCSTPCGRRCVHPLK